MQSLTDEQKRAKCVQFRNNWNLDRALDAFDEHRWPEPAVMLDDDFLDRLVILSEITQGNIAKVRGEVDTAIAARHRLFPGDAADAHQDHLTIFDLDVLLALYRLAEDADPAPGPVSPQPDSYDPIEPTYQTRSPTYVSPAPSDRPSAGSEDYDPTEEPHTRATYYPLSPLARSSVRPESSRFPSISIPPTPSPERTYEIQTAMYSTLKPLVRAPERNVDRAVDATAQNID